MKLMKDCHLTGREMHDAQCDVIFSKVKSQGKREITFEQFLLALDEVAKCRPSIGIDGVRKLIVTHGGKPHVRGTHAAYNRLSDDKNLRTGVHRYGGPSIVDGKADGNLSLNQVTDREPADIRGVSKGMVDDAANGEAAAEERKEQEKAATVIQGKLRQKKARKVVNGRRNERDADALAKKAAEEAALAEKERKANEEKSPTKLQAPDSEAAGGGQQEEGRAAAGEETPSGGEEAG